MPTTLSDQYGYVFIHVPKTAGRSVASALLESAAGQSLKTFQKARGLAPERRTPRRRKHHPARTVRRLLGEALYDSMESVAVVRNPYTRIRSLYRYQRQRDWVAEARIMPEPFNLEFDDFITRLCEQRPRPMTQYLMSERGELLVKSLLRFERLAEDFAAWSKKVVGAPIVLPETGRTAGSVEDAPFSERSIEAIQRTYADDFALFGYGGAPPQPSEA